MGTEQLMPFLLGVALGVIVSLAVASFWMRGRVQAMTAHQQRLEQARHQADQHMAQARKQIEHLQHEAHELRMEVLRHGGKPVQQRAPQPAPAVDPAEAARRYVESKLRPAAAEEEPEAFPETVILRRPNPAE